MSTPSFLPAELYLYREDAPHAGGARPLSQGDVFVEIPLRRAAKPHPATRWPVAASGQERSRRLLACSPPTHAPADLARRIG